MAVNDVYRLSHTQSCHGITCVNQHYYIETTSPSSGDAEADINSAFFTKVITPMMTNLGSGWRTECTVTRKLGSGANTPFENVTGMAGSRVTSETMPAATVAVVSHYTDLFNKYGRGRWYLSGLLVEDEDDNCWTGSAGTRLLAIADAMQEKLDGTGTGAEYDAVMMTGPPPDLPRLLIKIELRAQVRKLRSRTQARACG